MAGLIKSLIVGGAKSFFGSEEGVSAGKSLFETKFANEQKQKADSPIDVTGGGGRPGKNSDIYSIMSEESIHELVGNVQTALDKFNEAIHKTVEESAEGKGRPLLNLLANLSDAELPMEAFALQQEEGGGSIGNLIKAAIGGDTGTKAAKASAKNDPSKQALSQQEQHGGESLGSLVGASMAGQGSGTGKGMRDTGKQLWKSFWKSYVGMG